MNTYQRSSALFAAAKGHPGGSEFTRCVLLNLWVERPFFVEKAQGAYLFDADHQRYIDYIASWGPMILGHAHAPVIEAIQAQAEKGTSSWNTHGPRNGNRCPGGAGRPQYR